MPVNLRPQPSWYQGFGNGTFMVPVATRPEDHNDPTAIVTTIRRRTRRIKDRRTPPRWSGSSTFFRIYRYQSSGTLLASLLANARCRRPSCPIWVALIKASTLERACAPARCGFLHRPGCPWAWP
jgi:hypothetical protein